MNDAASQLIQLLADRVWDPKYLSYFYTDALPRGSELVDRWTGLFDKQRTACMRTTSAVLTTTGALAGFAP